MRFLFCFLSIFYVFSSSAFAQSSHTNNYNAISKNLEPIGIVDIAGKAKIIENKINDSAVPDRSGKEVYDQYCTVCHSIGAANSPKFGCASAWAPHKAKGMKVLFQHALSGYGFMPPRGSCGDCSNGEVEEAMRYMIDHSQDDKGC